MSKKSDPNLEDEEQAPIRYRKKPKKELAPPPQKQSYESNADVQRWLQLQALSSADLTKPKFQPTFLAGQRDSAWLLSSLSTFYEEDLILDVLHAIKSGKEASVYCCTAHPATGLAYAAAKVYRPRMFRSLRNDAVYRQSRTQRDVDGRVQRNTSRRHAQDAFKSERGRAMQVTSWIEYEFQTQQLLANAGADVPRALSQMGNAVLMEYIGDLGEPALRLQEIRLEPEEAQPLFDKVLQNIELFLEHNRIHGDLSAYNILYWEGDIKIIDFAQAVDPAHGEGIFPLLVRDIERVHTYFAHYGINADPYTLAEQMWHRQLGGL